MVRKATEADLAGIVDLTSAFYMESWKPLGLAWDRDAVLAALAGTLENEDAVIFIGSTNGAPPDGLIVGFAGLSTFSLQERIAQERVWYVRADFRGGPLAIRLLRAFEEWAKEKGCKLVTMAYPVSETDEVAARIYSRMGYHPVETFVAKEI